MFAYVFVSSRELYLICWFYKLRDVPLEHTHALVWSWSWFVLLPFFISFLGCCCLYSYGCFAGAVSAVVFACRATSASLRELGTGFGAVGSLLPYLARLPVRLLFMFLLFPFRGFYCPSPFPFWDLVLLSSFPFSSLFLIHFLVLSLAMQCWLFSGAALIVSRLWCAVPSSRVSLWVLRARRDVVGWYYFVFRAIFSVSFCVLV